MERLSHISSWRTPLTELGWTLLSVGLVMLATGFILSWIEFLVLGSCFLLLVAAAGLFVFGRMNVAISYAVERVRVTVGDPLHLNVAITNLGNRARSGMTVEIPVGRQAIEVRVPSLKAREVFEISRQIDDLDRGVYTIGPARLNRSDPVGLVSRRRVQGDRLRLSVWPRRRVVQLTASGRSHDLDGPTSDSSPEGGQAFHAIREYVPGDDLRLVHWRSTAKSGGNRLLVRQFVDNRSPLQLIVLDNSAGLAGAAAFELAVEVAASYVESARHARMAMRFVTGEGQSFSSDRPVQALDRLATVSVSEDLDFVQLTKAASQASDPSTSVVIVTTNASLGDALPHLNRMVAHDIEIVRIVESSSSPADADESWRRIRVTEVSSLDQLGSKHLGTRQ